MYPILMSLHVLFCLFLVLVVLVQSGKGAGFSGLVGGGSSDALFNAPSGSMFLRKLTTVIAAGFFITSLLLTYMGSKHAVRTVTQSFPASVPAAPQDAPIDAPSAQAPAAPPAAPEQKK